MRNEDVWRNGDERGGKNMVENARICEGVDE